jgi:hypothetical protein
MKKNKKKFKDTKAFKALNSPVVKGLLKSIPFGVGSIAGNVLDETATSPAGEVDKKNIGPQLIKLVIYAFLIYLLLFHGFDMDQLQDAKELLSD